MRNLELLFIRAVTDRQTDTLAMHVLTGHLNEHACWSAVPEHLQLRPSAEVRRHLAHDAPELPEGQLSVPIVVAIGE
jgi:hypothetical protein